MVGSGPVSLASADYAVSPVIVIRHGSTERFRIGSLRTASIVELYVGGVVPRAQIADYR
jgi:hypothetical protein